jgi:N-acetylmuramoyl-L-alanine amidase
MDEGAETIVLRDLISNRLREMGHTVYNDLDDMPLRGVVAWIRRQFTGRDILLEIHFNAGPPKARGTEVFISNYASNQTLGVANLIAGIIPSITDHYIYLRGVKQPGQSQHKRLAILDDTPTIAVLWEICFITNQDEVLVYQKIKNRIAEYTANILSSLV